MFNLFSWAFSPEKSQSSGQSHGETTDLSLECVDVSDWTIIQRTTTTSAPKPISEDVPVVYSRKLTRKGSIRAKRKQRKSEHSAALSKLEQRQKSRLASNDLLHVVE
eukprot:228060_1